MKYTEENLNLIDWQRIQKYYDDGNFWRDLLSNKELGLNSRLLNYAIKNGLIKMRTRTESAKLSKIIKPQKHTLETRNKISKIRIEYLKNNPHKAPYKLNHSSKESYPERYFNDVFNNEGIEVERYYQVGIYEMDFSIPQKRIDIEIDGSQHYSDLKIVESDKRRAEYLKSEGWSIIRINWSAYKQMNSDEKQIYIKNIKDRIEHTLNVDDNFEIFSKKIIKTQCICGNTKYKSSKQCLKCNGLKNRKTIRPEYDILVEEFEEFGYTATGKKYGVSDNAIRKWLKCKGK